MDIVFIHGNYPAQFRHLATALGSEGKHRVFYITAREDAEMAPIKGVTLRIIKSHRAPSHETHHYVTATEEAVIKGQSVIREINTMIGEGINPRIVISHGGMGLGLYIKDMIPEVLHIGLFEWYFQPNTSKWLVKEFDLNAKLMTRTRNLPINDEILTCDIGVVPTKWQKSQFPKEIEKKLKVIFDGIDREFFREEPGIDEANITIQGEYLNKPLCITKETKVLSYATRGMEPLRGFPEFMKVASAAFKK